LIQIGKVACNTDVSGVLTAANIPAGASIPADVSCTYLLLVCLVYAIAGIPSVAKNPVVVSFGRAVLGVFAAAVGPAVADGFAAMAFLEAQPLL
jgi:hypothetical protein